jgi:glycosyltransferase involved in cell wall biosynthesis
MSEFPNKRTPAFSIIIPTYKRIAELKTCLEALSNQSADKDHFEIIVVNDGGDRVIVEDVEAFKDRLSIRYFFLKHRGPAGARNYALAIARGDIVIFLDDDSVPKKGWLDATQSAWKQSPDVDGIGGYIRYEPTDNIYCKTNAHFVNWYLKQHSSEQNCTFLITCNAGYKKEILEKVQGFTESFESAAGEDRDLNIRILQMGARLRLDKNIAVYHNRDLSFSGFMRKHTKYGKVARILHTKYPEAERLSIQNYLDFFRSILNGRKSPGEKCLITFLFAVSQLFTAIGYLEAMFTKRHWEMR